MNVPERIAFATAEQPCLARCLGRFHVEDGAGNRVDIRTRKARALLAVLALCGRAMSRDALADLLWSDRGPVQARGSLRQAIFELQHVSGDKGFLTVSRDELAIRTDHLATDLDRIRAAAQADDAALLASLLREAEPGLLTDLDGLDHELDSWLRLQRATEPGSVIAAALAAAERLWERGGKSDAMHMVDELLRLDPCNEQAARVAMRIDHEQGDGPGLRRRYALLKDRIREDFDAGPSAGTSELFARLVNENSGIEVADEEAEPMPAAQPATAKPLGRRRRLILPALAAVALAIAAVLAIFHTVAPSGADDALLVAVLPFREQGSGDAFLADGLSDDTRAAISRTGSIRVLGRATTAAAITRKLSPDQYRRRFGVDYLLDGAVQRSGDSIRVSVSLTRTSDGVGVWQDSFAARVGDSFAVQSAIASGIEGKLRGRLAPGGGRRAEQIATTPEVYGLYTRARPLLRTREPSEARMAQALLRRAVAIDPNFAPAWSSLAAAIFLGRTNPAGSAAEDAEARRAAAHALTLAPNLAEAQATLGLIEADNTSESEAAMRRAVALDPSYAEAWNWLGNALASDARYGEAEAAYARSVELDPLWFVPASNLISVARNAGDARATARLFHKLSFADAGRDITMPLRAKELIGAGDYSRAVQVLAAVDPPNAKPSQRTKSLWLEALTRLGEEDAGARRVGVGDWYGPTVRGERMPPSVIDGRRLTPADFWQDMAFSTFAARALVDRGHGDELVRLYRAQFRNADAFISAVGHGDQLVFLVPILASALRAQGGAGEADYLLKDAEITAETAARNAPLGAEPAAKLAYVWAAQGRDDAALQQLGAAISRGWLPDGTFQALDFAREPAFLRLSGDPRLRPLRRRVLDHIAKERMELGRLPF